MAVQSSTRKWVFIGGGVIAAVALVVLFQNYPPQPKDAAGTIGAAQRYHEPQITGADVAVSQDALTTWIQSDTFDRIVKDPQARRLFADAAVTALINDAALKMKLQDASGKDADGDAVRLKRLVAVDDARTNTVEVTLDADAVRRLSEVVDKDTAGALKAAFDGGDAATQKKLHLAVAPDLAMKLHLIQAPGSDAAKTQRVEYKDATDAAKTQRIEFKDATDAARVTFTTDEARSVRLALNQQDYALVQAGGDQMRKFHLSMAPDEARRLGVILGAEAMRKLSLIEAKAAGDAARTIELNLDAATANALRAALDTTTDGMSHQVALSPDAMRKVSFALDVEQARVQGFKINEDAMRVQFAALDNQAISAALGDRNFLRAISDNPGLLNGLVVKTRSEFIDNTN